MQQYHLDKTIQFILAGQRQGYFPTYEYYPVWKPQDGWTELPDSSPFIVSNLLYCLLEINDPRLNDAIDDGCKYLLRTMEHGGYFRFWPHIAKQHPIPLDMDDTSLSSYVLSKCNHALNNKQALLANVNSKGYLLTWLQPSLGLLFSQPVTAFSFALGCIHGIPTRLLRFLKYTDAEPAVAANGLLYLQQNGKTQACINAIIDEVESHNFPMQYYEDELVVYYHIARAYKHSVPAFAALKDTIAWRIQKRFAQGMDTANELWRSMAAVTLLNFDTQHALAEVLLDSVANSGMCPDKWVSVPYFCSPNRNFLAGSPQYTAAVYAEAVAKLLRLKREGSHA